ncbi:MAG: DMT family transporter [Myxococcota bacterium]
MENVRKGLMEVNAATVLLGFVALFAKWIDLPPRQIIFGRCAVAAAALLLLLAVRRRSPRLGRGRDYVVVVFLGALLATHWVLYFQAIQVSTVAVAIIALFTYPIITVLLEPLVFRARIARADVLTALAVLFGVALMVPGFSLESSTGQGVFWGVASASLYAARNVFQKKYLTAPRSSVVMLYQVAVGALVLLPFQPSGSAPGTTAWMLPLVLLGVVFTALPHTLLLDSLSHLKAKTLGIVQSLQPAYGIALAAIFYEEYPSWRTLGGGAIILAAAVYESRKVSRARP